jgi:PrcB C-terminal
MRQAWLMAAVLLWSGCAAATAKEPNLKFRDLKHGGFASSSSATPQIVLARDAEAYRRIWDVLIGSGSPPQIDPAHEAAIFLLDRQHHTGGYSVEVEGVGLDGGTAIVKAVLHTPERGSITTQVLTTPFAVIAIPSSGVTAARWVDASKGTVVVETPKSP